jgi:hypothetical protein
MRSESPLPDHIADALLSVLERLITAIIHAAALIMKPSNTMPSPPPAAALGTPHSMV